MRFVIVTGMSGGRKINGIKNAGRYGVFLRRQSPHTVDEKICRDACRA